MKKILSFLFLFFTIQLIAASGINGKIIDADTQTPLDFVNVALFKQGSDIPAAGVITNKDGIFNIPAVPNGKYNIRVSFVGYTTFNQILNVNEKPLNIGVIKLVEDSKRLAEVEVIGQGSTMRFDIDKKVFSVDQSIAAAGGSASDVLKNIPSVTVDIEGNVSLRKDANVEVWVNGKPSGLTADNRAQVLQQMPAESIESIEIMTNPSAKFNPEGTAGIINLVLKKNRKAGHYGSVSAGLMYPEGGKMGGSLGANINYSSSKIDAYANIGYRAMSFQGGGKNDRYNYIKQDSTTLLSQNNTMNNAFSGLFMRSGVDFHLDTLNTISLSGFGMVGSGNSINNINYLLTNSPSNTVLRDYNRNTIGTGSRPSLNVNLDYLHEFDKKGSNLTANLSFSNHTRPANSEYIQNDAITTYKSDIIQLSEEDNKELVFKTDYTNKISETAKLEAGWQSSISNRLSKASGRDSLNHVDMPAYYNNFNYNEQIHAAYLTYGNRFDKLTVQAGLRAEYMWKQSTNTTATTVQNLVPKTYFQLFPSMYLSYTLPNNNELQLNYTRRVNRPRGRQINPFKNYSDSTNISFGNANLSPEFSSALEFNYLKTWDNHSLSASVYYHYTDSVIENVRYIHAGTMENTFMNIAKTQNTGIELVAKNQLFTILNLTSSLNMYYSKMNASVFVDPYNVTTTIPGQSNFSWSANILANFMLSKTFSGQITGEYESPELIAQGTEAARYSVDLGLRKTFLDRKLSLNLMVRDILNSERHRSTTSGTGFYQTSESYFHGRMIGLSVSYNFGNIKPKQTEKKKTDTAPDMNLDNGME